MAAALGTRWEVIARLALGCAWLWLACGERPPEGDSAPLHKAREAQALQALGTWGPTGAMARAREEHTATRLPSGKVLVVGGSRIASAEVYDPATGAWSPTGATIMPRYRHTATLLPSGRVLVIGGNRGSGSSLDCCLASAEVYDPATGTWSYTGSMALDRQRHTATLLPSGKVLVAGGNPQASAEVYDPATGTWSSTGSMASARESHTATLLPSGKVLVTGGARSDGSLASAEVYDPATGTWSPTGALASARESHTATLLPSGQLLVLGGERAGVPLASAEVYDPATGTWSPMGTLASARESHTATLFPDGKVLVAGGHGSSGSLASAEVYRPTLGAWRPTGVPTTQRYHHTATRLTSGKVLVAGGSSSASAEVYDPATGTWRLTGSMTKPRSLHTAALLSSDKVLVAGDDTGWTNSTELYDPATNTWRLTGSSMTLRAHAMTRLLSGEVLVTGGRLEGRGTWVLETQVYDPTTGTWRFAGYMTTPRSKHTATVLPSGQVLVTGGLDALFWPLASAELYDPATGTWRLTGSMTTVRSEHTALLLSSGKVLVLGGSDPEHHPLASAEVYDPATGAWSPTAAMATARSDYTVTLLPSGKVLVLGGSDLEHHPLASAEVYDPAADAWDPTAAMATARSAHTATLLLDGKVLVAGGSSPLAKAEVYQEAPAVLTPARGAVVMDSQPTYTGTAEAGSTVRVIVEGVPVGTAKTNASGRWTFVQPVALGDGAYRVMVTAAGNLLTAESLATPFAVDATPPTVPGVLTPARDSLLNNNRPTYGGSAEPGSTVRVNVDGTALGSTTANASGEWALPQPVALKEGPHTLRVTATDAVGNVSPEFDSYAFTVDTTPPATPGMFTPADGASTHDSRPAYRGTAEQETTVTVWLDETAVGSARTNAAGEWRFTPDTVLSEGLHRTVVTATDPAGNASAPSPARFFKVDTVPPAAPEVLSLEAIVYTRRPLIGGTAEAQSTVTVWLDGTAVGTALADEAGAWHLTPSTALADGRHLAVAIATDAADNSSGPSAEVSFSMSQRGYYVSGCASSPTSLGDAWPWALLLLALPRPRSRPARPARLPGGRPL